MRRLLRVMGPTAAAVALLVVGLASPAQASTTVNASGGTSCPSGQLATAVSLTLTSASSGQTISVQTALSSKSASPDSVSGGTATYTVSLDAQYRSASATVPDGWAGSFTVTGTTCSTASPAGVLVRSSQAGVTPITIAVVVGNHNGVLENYRVSLSGFGSITVGVLGHHTQEVDFSPANCGTRYVASVTGEDGTTATGSGTSTACPPGVSPPPPPPPPTPGVVPSKATAAPSASALRSPSASPSPSVSTSASSDGTISLGPALPENMTTPSPDTPLAATKSGLVEHIFTPSHLVMGVGFVLFLIGVMVIVVLVRASRRNRYHDPDSE